MISRSDWKLSLLQSKTMSPDKKKKKKKKKQQQKKTKKQKHVTTLEVTFLKLSP